MGYLLLEGASIKSNVHSLLISFRGVKEKLKMSSAARQITTSSSRSLSGR